MSMGFTIKTAKLAALLKPMAAATAKKETIPILSCVKLEVDDNGKLNAYTSNLATGIARVTDTDKATACAIAIPFRLLSDLVSALPGDQPFKAEINARTQTLTAICGRNKSSLKGFDAQDFPTFSLSGKPDFSIESTVLGSALRRTIFAAATDESRPVLTAVNFIIDDDGLTLVAADGFRASVVKGPAGFKGKAGQYIVPATSLAAVEKLCTEKDVKEVHISFLKNSARFTAGNTTVIAQQLEGGYPDVKKLVPQKHEVEFTIETAEIRKAVKTVLLFSTDTKLVRIQVTDGNVALMGESANAGNTVIDLPAQTTGALEFALNGGYLSDALESMAATQTTFKLIDGSRPVKLHPTGSTNYTHVIMPMAILVSAPKKDEPAKPEATPKAAAEAPAPTEPEATEDVEGAGGEETDAPEGFEEHAEGEDEE